MIVFDDEIVKIIFKSNNNTKQIHINNVLDVHCITRKHSETLLATLTPSVHNSQLRTPHHVYIKVALTVKYSDYIS